MSREAIAAITASERPFDRPWLGATPHDSTNDMSSMNVPQRLTDNNMRSNQ
ncbi:hypothetical protein [Burkholderia stagnalis]|uniref:hypothetical protein n=1 Tax=Burkholderia stagnalis TaxID=1503054 RepID=UPI000AA8C548|nr:hypothetical protein [Burkholderia stagnalis]